MQEWRHTEPVFTGRQGLPGQSASQFCVRSGPERVDVGQLNEPVRMAADGLGNVAVVVSVVGSRVPSADQCADNNRHFNAYLIHFVEEGARTAPGSWIGTWQS